MLNVEEVKKAISEDLKLAENEAQLSEFWKKCLGKGGTNQ